jgi:predicted nucleotidyltransferase
MEIVLPQPFKSYSVKHISRLINSSYALTYDSMKNLLSKKLVKAKKIGNALVCQLNLSADPQLLAIASLTLSQKFLDKVRFGFIIDEIKNKLSNYLYILALFGSYAKGTATKASDVDILLIVQHKTDIEKVKRKVESVLISTDIEIEFDVITTKWLVKMFEERDTVGREVLESSIILHGAEQYYSMVNSYDKERGH